MLLTYAQHRQVRIYSSTLYQGVLVDHDLSDAWRELGIRYFNLEKEGMLVPGNKQQQELVQP